MVFVAVSIPKLARQDASVYRASLEAHSNNIHCLAAAVNSIFGALFTIYGQNDVEDRLKEFLAVRAKQFYLPCFLSYNNKLFKTYSWPPQVYCAWVKKRKRRL